MCAEKECQYLGITSTEFLISCNHFWHLSLDEEDYSRMAGDVEWEYHKLLLIYGLSKTFIIPANLK